jgi:tripartite-type tricarboxylate transporter receptor subunit TctC
MTKTDQMQRLAPESRDRMDEQAPSHLRRQLLAALGALTLCGAAVAQAPAPAESFPSRPLKIVVPIGPGRGSDTAIRLVAQRLEVAFKQGVVVENRPGANGSIGATYVARSAPDGLTLLLGTTSTHGANPGLVAKLGYDPVKDFSPVGMVGTFSSFLVVHPSVPARTPAELMAYAKANPKALSFAAGNTSSLIMGEMFARRAGAEMLRVPYQSNPAGLTDVIAGRVQVMFPDISSSMAHVKAGSVRALGVVSMGGRSSQAPELPTMAELGVSDFNFVGWIGLFAPTGTPEPIVRRIADELERVVKTPEVTQRLQQLGADPLYMGPTQFDAFVRSEVERLPRLLATMGVQPQ